jgi:hypothetical protein
MTTKPEIDMSERAITARLEQLRALYKLMVHLGQARTLTGQPLRPPR